MRTVLALSLLAAVLTSISAYADEVTPAQKEEAYLLICAPGSDAEKGLEESKLAEAIQLRNSLQEFFRNPEPLVNEFKQMKMFGGKENGSIGGAIMFGIFCGTTEVLKDVITERGCQDEKGNAISIAKAAALCTPLIDQAREKN